MRNYDEWILKFKPSISGYDFYVDFDKVYNNIEKIKVELNILNSLIGSKDIEREFREIVQKYPETLKCIPILIAKREKSIFCSDKNGGFEFDFYNMNYSIDDYVNFMEKTGLFNLIQNNIIGNLYDYVLGVEVGLDSNSRKNRGGLLMEHLVESYIKDAGFIENINYFKQLQITQLEQKIGKKLESLYHLKNTIKKFDFVLLTSKNIYLCECNFYSSSGSKLNETSRSYKSLANDINKVRGLKFVWFTDGIGWLNNKNILKETFDILEDIYSIDDLENGILKKLK